MAEDMENGGAPESVQSEQDAGKETGSTLMTETGNESAKEQEAVGAPQNSGEEPKAEPEKAEPYTLTAPEGYPISEKELSDFNRHCLEVGMTKEQAEKSLEMLHSNFKATQEAFEAQRRDWVAEIKSDKEYGGEKFKETVADAKRALAQFDEGGTIRTLLEETGYGDNPAIIKVFAKVGRAMAEDKIVGKGGAGGKKPLAERLYPDM